MMCPSPVFFFFFFNDTATTEIYTLSLHDALPISLLGMISSILVGQYGQSRILFAMSRDRLLPGMFCRVHRRFETPDVSTWLAGVAVAIPAGVWDIGTFADLTNIGTLFAFVVVSGG